MQVPVDPRDPEVREAWFRETDDPGVRNVNALYAEPPGEVAGWQVSIWAMEFVREDPLESEYRQRITDALRQVSGVTSAEEQDNETWFVTGNPSGQALMEAACQVVDDLADRVRDLMCRLDDGGFWPV